MQTTIITHEGFVELFDLRVLVSEPDEHGLCSVRAVELTTGEVWFDGEWTGDRLDADDPDAVPMELYLDIEETVARLAVGEVAA